MTRRKLESTGTHLVRRLCHGTLLVALAGGPVLAQATGEAQQRSQSEQTATRPAGGTAQTQPARTSRIEQRTRAGRESQEGTQAHRQREQPGQERDIASRLRLVPDGWVAIGYDFDGDGQYDAVERIYTFDIEQARTRSQARHEGRRPGRGAMAGDGRRGEPGLMQRGRQNIQRGEETWRRGVGTEQGDTHRVEGEIVDLNTVHMAGMRHPHLFGRVRDERGRTASVDFGPRFLLDRLNLESGDRVTVTGTSGRYHERAVLLAQEVEANNETITVDRPRGRELMERMGERMEHAAEREGERVRGEFLAFRRAAFRGHSHDHLLARMRLNDGTMEVVDLGPVDELEHVRMRRGDQVELIVHRARINGEPAYLAERIRMEDGQMVQIDVSEGWDDRPRLRGTPVAPTQGDRAGERGSRTGQSVERESFFDQESTEQRERGVRQQGRGESPQATTTRPASEGEVAHTITIVARGNEFHPNEITVEPGQTVRVLLMNRGQEEYSIEFELPSGPAELSTPLQAGQSQILEFTAPEQEGTYPFFSSVGNHREQGMTGKLIVARSQ